MGDLADLFSIVDNGDSPKWILEKILSRSEDVEAFEYAAAAGFCSVNSVIAFVSEYDPARPREVHIRFPCGIMLYFHKIGVIHCWTLS